MDAFLDSKLAEILLYIFAIVAILWVLFWVGLYGTLIVSLIADWVKDRKDRKKFEKYKQHKNFK